MTVPDALLEDAAAELDTIDPPAPGLDQLLSPTLLGGAGDVHLPDGRSAPPVAPDPDEPSSFERIDLGPVVAGRYRQPKPDQLSRDDGAHLFYSGQVNGIHGDSGSGKGWISGLAMTQAIRAGRKVMMLDLEDVPVSIVARLRLLGLTDDEIVNGLDYRRPTEPFTITTVQQLCDEITAENHALVVIDSLGEAFALHGVNEDKDAEVGPWLRGVARPLADTGAAVILIDHSTKANDNPLHPSGSKRKRAAIGGASYLLEATEPLKKGAGGRLRLTCAKDRHGNYARKEVVGHFVMTPSLLGPELTNLVDVHLTAPPANQHAGGEPAADLALYAQRIIRTVRDSDVPLSKKTAVKSTKGRGTELHAGLEHAINTGCLSVEKGKHGAHLLTFERDLEFSK